MRGYWYRVSTTVQTPTGQQFYHHCRVRAKSADEAETKALRRVSWRFRKYGVQVDRAVRV